MPRYVIVPRQQTQQAPAQQQEQPGLSPLQGLAAAGKAANLGAMGAQGANWVANQIPSLSGVSPTLSGTAGALGTFGNLAGTAALLGSDAPAGQKAVGTFAGTTRGLQAAASIPGATEAVPALGTAAAANIPGTAVNALGAAGGLASVGLGAYQMASGNIPGGLMSLATLLPAGWVLALTQAAAMLAAKMDANPERKMRLTERNLGRMSDAAQENFAARQGPMTPEVLTDVLRRSATGAQGVYHGLVNNTPQYEGLSQFLDRSTLGAYDAMGRMGAPMPQDVGLGQVLGAGERQGLFPRGTSTSEVASALQQLFPGATSIADLLAALPIAASLGAQNAGQMEGGSFFAPGANLPIPYLPQSMTMPQQIQQATGTATPSLGQVQQAVQNAVGMVEARPYTGEVAFNPVAQQVYQSLVSAGANQGDVDPAMAAINARNEAWAQEGRFGGP